MILENIDELIYEIEYIEESKTGYVAINTLKDMVVNAVLVSGVVVVLNALNAGGGGWDLIGSLAGTAGLTALFGTISNSQQYDALKEASKDKRLTPKERKSLADAIG
jgi:hypothetical protein